MKNQYAKMLGIRPATDEQLSARYGLVLDNTDTNAQHGMRGTRIPVRPVRQLDVCSHLFEICKARQNDPLDIHGITCFFDVDSGALAAWRCHILGYVVEALIEGACLDRTTKSLDAKITVSLRHTKNLWVLAVADQGIRSFNRGSQFSAPAQIQELVEELSGVCRSQTTPEGVITAVLFTTAACDPTTWN